MQAVLFGMDSDRIPSLKSLNLLKFCTLDNEKAKKRSVAYVFIGICLWYARVYYALA